MWVDPAGKKSLLRRVRARQAMAIIGANDAPLPFIFVLYSWAGKLTTTRFRDKIVDVYKEYQPRQCGIEANAMQELFGDLVKDKAKEDCIGPVRIRPISVPTNVDKDARIRTILEPVISTYRLFIPASMVELLSELTGFPTGQFKDIVDCLASAIKMVPKRTGKGAAEHEVRQLAAYLRGRGHPAYYIEERVEEYRRELAA